MKYGGSLLYEKYVHNAYSSALNMGFADTFEL